MLDEHRLWLQTHRPPELGLVGRPRAHPADLGPTSELLQTLVPGLLASVMDAILRLRLLGELIEDRRQRERDVLTLQHALLR